MSKKITHEQIRNHFKDNFNANDVKYEDIRIITEYITQQEKQEKLLELYKERNKIYEKLELSYKDHKRIIDIEFEIKEIEND